MEGINRSLIDVFQRGIPERGLDCEDPPAAASSSKITASWMVRSLASDAITDPGALQAPTLPTSEALLADVDAWTADTVLSLPLPLPLRALLQHCEEMWPSLPQLRHWYSQ